MGAPEMVGADKNRREKEVSFDELGPDWPEQFKEKLLFQKDLLLLLNDTNLFGPMLEKALEDIEKLIQTLDTLRASRSLEISPK